MRRPVSVLVVVYTDDANVLMLRRRSPFKFWQSVTGSLHDGEQPVDAAKRELKEETGLESEGTLEDSGITRQFTIDPRWRDRYPKGVTENTEHEWRYLVHGEPEIHINLEEHSEYCWMSIDDAIDAVWSWTNREALESLRSQVR